MAQTRRPDATGRDEGLVGGFLTSVRHVSPTQQVREQLLTAIERGDFPAGSLLPSERVLCETFGVSRVSVREAIAGLEAMGLITVQHGRGAFVRAGVGSRYAGPFAKYLELHRAELAELMMVRGALDELTAEQAALHGSDEDVAKVSDACRAFREAAEAEPQNTNQLSDLDRAFHMSIAEASGGSLLPQLVRELHSLLDESRRISLGLSGQPQASVKQHQAIADAIVARDAKGARRAVARHASHVSNRLQRLAASGEGSEGPDGHS